VTSGENDTAIASATIAMAHSLNLSVTAEGVEEQEQLDFYRAHGCDEFQGYLLAKPGSPDEITRMIEESARPSVGRAKSGAPTM
jgi:EAL domain-containing protein (putative c-di-GMP-specific phosphodiesterase class I)